MLGSYPLYAEGSGYSHGLKKPMPGCKWLMTFPDLSVIMPPIMTDCEHPGLFAELSFGAPGTL
jgi:hypothetical protein